MNDNKTTSAAETALIYENQAKTLDLEKQRIDLMRRELSTQQNIAALRDLEDTSMIPKSMQGKLALSEQFSKSNLLPEAYRGKPNECFVALQFGEMMGFTNPMSCFQSVYVVEGRPSASADSMLGCCMVQPEFMDYENELIDLGNDLEYSRNTAFKDQTAKWEKFKVRNYKSISRIIRKMPNGKDRVFERFHTTEMSLNRFAKYPQWQNDQISMLKHRSDGKVCRSAFPAVFSGIHSPDEVIDFESSIEVQDGSGNKTGTIKKESLHQNVVNEDIFSNASVKGGGL